MTSSCFLIVNSIPGHGTCKEVIVQGKQTKAVVQLLVQRGVPIEYIEVKGKEKKISPPKPGEFLMSNLDFN